MKYIEKANQNIDSYAFLNNTVFNAVFFYKLYKYDAIGAIESRQWSAVDGACRSMLYYGLQGYLANKGYCAQNLGMSAVVKSALPLLDSDVVAIVERLIYLPVNTDLEILESYMKCVELVEKLLIPVEFWEFLGKEGLIVWENWMLLLRQIKELELSLGCNFTATGPMSLEQLESWTKLTKDVFEA